MSRCSCYRRAAADTATTADHTQVIIYHVLFGVFGLAPWNVTSALFAQLPLVLPSSPQLSQLPSYMDLATNLGNVPMLLYLACAGAGRCCPLARREPHQFNARSLYVMFALALLTALGFATLWRDTVHGFSIFVVCFAFCGGCVGDIMMVAAFPYLTQFQPAYTSSFSTGVSGHGLLTNGLAVLQDVGGESPRFGVGWFMVLVSAVQLFALAAFRTIRQHEHALCAEAAAAAAGRGGAETAGGMSGALESSASLSPPDGSSESERQALAHHPASASTSSGCGAEGVEQATSASAPSGSVSDEEDESSQIWSATELEAPSPPQAVDPKRRHRRRGYAPLRSSSSSSSTTHTSSSSRSPRRPAGRARPRVVSSTCGSCACASFRSLVALQAWTNYVYFLIPALLP
jgi:hypothetical protein